ncbi:hypothetical protein HPB47_013295 [Ixodes persulcatus]|uniref:Uncharacterized protein n=1 Tax=Ixodes persulcatus TaxID=34615 RepID=A0AC60R110_IXOPE|nr:hypothetical protein HPB47_013295 [Ixodes persulcatus]
MAERRQLRRRGSLLEDVQAPAFNLVICLVVAVILIALLVAVLSKKYVSQADQKPSRPDLRGNHAGIQILKGRGMPLQDANDCRSPLCDWNTGYIFSKVEENNRPCDDFYAHVCSKAWFGKGNVSSRPFREFSAAQLMLDVESFFKNFLHLKGNTDSPGDNFLSQAIWTYGKCKTGLNTTVNVSSSMEWIFENLGIRGWPLDSYGGDLASLVGTGDRLMRLHPLFRVTVRKIAGSRTALSVLISPPITYYRRFMMKSLGSNEESYLDLVDKTLHLWTSAKRTGAAKAIVDLEKSLERFTLAFNEELMMPPRSKFVRLGDLFLTSRWDWETYFRVLTTGNNTIVTNETEVALGDLMFLQNIGGVLSDTWTTVIANYIGYKAVVELSSALGQGADYLQPLTHDYHITDLRELQVACMVLLEKLYHYGIGIAARLTLGKEFATTDRTHFNSQLGTLFQVTKTLLVHMVASHRSWIDPLDSGVASRKLNTMDFVFGAQYNLLEYELYRKTSTLFIDETEALPGTIFRIFTFASAAYWDSLANDSGAYDNLYDSTVFQPGHEYHELNNLLFVPQAVVSFINHVTNKIHPFLYPVVAIHVMRGALRALTRAGSFTDDQSVSRAWWSSATTNAYVNISACLQSQYETPETTQSSVSSMEENFLDNAALYPLFGMYVTDLTKLNTSRKLISIGRKQIGFDKMFFYNFAAAHCESGDSDKLSKWKFLGEHPPRFRVNVPLRNLKLFAKVFGCPPNSYMNPAKKCAVWKRFQFKSEGR